MQRLFETVNHYDVQRWGRDFLEGLKKATAHRGANELATNE